MKLQEEHKKEVLKYLAQHRLMSVGTYYKLPWAASVYYLVDDNFNFYFVSDPATKHCQNIAKNSKVSITVADSSQKSTDTKVGFAARGIAKKLTNVAEVKGVIEAWNKRGFVPITYKLMMKAWKSRFYKIKLTHIQLFDENQSKDNEVRLWKI